MPEQLSDCPVCKSTHITKAFNVEDFSVSKQGFEIYTCTDCGFLFTNPRPNIDEISSYYQSEDYISHTDTNKGLINKIYHRVRKITLAQKLKLINRLTVSKGTLLDIGCGTGYFLQTAKTNGWKVIGTEPDPKARQQAKQKTNADIYTDFLDDEVQIKADIITMWHVLEHVHLLDDTMLKIQKSLKNEGALVIAVPNHLSHDAQHYQNFWAAYDVPRHLYHFNPKTITILTNRFGFKLTETYGMPFDGFYVSMLSEKYRGGNILSAAFVAGVGYLKALLGNKNQYSSLIYVFRKK
jgi:2-polyprenyl-3-methyl-5-hydroxy-6-metoxy-1,4-benzoquinol methylase